MTVEEERRALERIVVNGQVRVRPAGSGDEGQLCRVRDASPEGVRLIVDEGRAIRDDGEVLEVLTASGRQQESGIELAVIWREHRDDGLQHVGCSFVE